MSTIQSRAISHAQNFLHSGKLVDRLIEGSTLAANDDVVEIGPGRGIITERLARRCRRVIAVEKDRELADRLRRRFGGFSNVTIHAADFLECPLPTTRYKVFASIPFNITTAIVSKLTSGLSPPDDAYLVVQREAAIRFTGEPRESLYSVLLKPWFDPTLVHAFKRTDFEPIPGVDIVMIRLRERALPMLRARDARFFRDFVVYGFTAWQPTIQRTIERLLGFRGSILVLRAAGIAVDASPSHTCFEQWLDLARLTREVGGSPAERRIAGSEQQLRRQQERLAKLQRTRTRGRRSEERWLDQIQ